MKNLKLLPEKKVILIHIYLKVMNTGQIQCMEQMKEW